MSVIAPQGTYVWGRQAPGERPATLLREQELPPSAFNKDQLKPAPGTRQSERRGGKGLYAPQMGPRQSDRRIPPTPFTPSASAAYTPPVMTMPADFNLSSRRAFPLGRQPRPYAGLSRRTTQSALAYVESGQTDDTGASGPAAPPPDMAARDRLPLTQIANAARDLSDAVAGDADKDALDDVRGVAVALSATAMKRPLTEEEDKLWRTLSDKIGEIASKAAAVDVTKPAQVRKRRVVLGVPASTRSATSTATIRMPQTAAEEKAMTKHFTTFIANQRAMTNTSQQSYLNRAHFASAILSTFGLTVMKKPSRVDVIGQLENLVSIDPDPFDKIMRIGKNLGIEFISNTRTVKP